MIGWRVPLTSRNALACSTALGVGWCPEYVETLAATSPREPEHAGGQLVVLLQLDPYGTGEGVALLLGVLAYDVGELTGEADVHRDQPVEVARAELDVEVVGHDRAASGDGRRALVELALEVARDLHRLDVGPEGLGEGAVHHALELLLEAVQDAHGTSSLSYVADSRTAGRGASRTAG